MSMKEHNRYHLNFKFSREKPRAWEQSILKWILVGVSSDDHKYVWAPKNAQDFKLSRTL